MLGGRGAACCAGAVILAAASMASAEWQALVARERILKHRGRGNGSTLEDADGSRGRNSDGDAFPALSSRVSVASVGIFSPCVVARSGVRHGRSRQSLAPLAPPDDRSGAPTVDDNLRYRTRRMSSASPPSPLRNRCSTSCNAARSLGQKNRSIAAGPSSHS